MLELAKSPVLQINASYECIGWLNFNKAVAHLVAFVEVDIGTKKIMKPKAYIFESIPDRYVYGPPVMEGTRRQLDWPVSIVMEKYARLRIEDMGEMDESLAAHSAILRRDGFKCMYCGKAGSTWDHILPQSRGGQNTWWNLTTACVTCNSFKANRTPEEAGMKLLREPFKPAADKFSREQKRVNKLLEAA